MRVRTLLLLSLLAGCGTTGPLKASVAQFEVKPLPTLVARKVALPLYVVVGKDDIPEAVHVSGMSIFIFTVPDVDLANVRTFATRDVKRALEPYFATVNVVYSEAELPRSPHVRAQIKVSKIEYERRISAGHNGQHNEFFGALEWAFAIRAWDQPDSVFRFSERTVSAEQMKGFSDTSEWPSTFQEAVRHLVAEYDKSGAQEKLIALVAPDPYAN